MSKRALAVIVAVAGFGAGICIGHFLIAQSAPNTAAAAAVTVPQGATVLPVSAVSLEENASSSPAVAISYPQFPSLSQSFNDAVASSTLGRYASFVKSAAATEQARAATGASGAVIPPSAYSFSASWEPAQITNQYVSFVEKYDFYAGGASGDQELQTFNYNVAQGKVMTLADLFPGVPDYLTQVAALARSELQSSLSAASNGNVSESMLDAGTEPTTADFANFTFTDDAITFYFPKYAVAPGYFGDQQVTISRSAVK